MLLWRWSNGQPRTWWIHRRSDKLRQAAVLKATQTTLRPLEKLWYYPSFRLTSTQRVRSIVGSAISLEDREICLRDNTDDQKLFREELRGPEEWGAVQAMGTHKIPACAGFVPPVTLCLRVQRQFHQAGINNKFETMWSSLELDNGRRVVEEWCASSRLCEVSRKLSLPKKKN